MPPILLGTGASEGIPAVFCDCPVCVHARRAGGREIRTRSCMLLNESTMVDFSPDIFTQAQRNAISLRKLSRIILTHFHEDHFNISEMAARMSGVPTLRTPIDIICSAPLAEQMKLLFRRICDHNQEEPFDYFKYYRFLCIEPFDRIDCGDFAVTAIMSSHHGYGVREIGYNYLITGHGKTLLYAVDTGWYPQQTWEYLAGKKLDGIVMECTYGNQPLPFRAPEHLNFANVIEMLRRMQKIGCITLHTPVWLTHLCHLSTASPQQTEKIFSGCGYTVILGYDGMPLRFPPEK